MFITGFCYVAIIIIIIIIIVSFLFLLLELLISLWLPWSIIVIVIATVTVKIIFTIIIILIAIIITIVSSMLVVPFLIFSSYLVIFLQLFIHLYLLIEGPHWKEGTFPRVVLCQQFSVSSFYTSCYLCSHHGQVVLAFHLNIDYFKRLTFISFGCIFLYLMVWYSTN